MYVDACGGQRLTLGVFFDYSLPYFETGSLVSMDFIDSARLVSQVPPYSAFLVAEFYRHIQFFCF